MASPSKGISHYYQRHIKDSLAVDQNGAGLINLHEPAPIPCKYIPTFRY